MLYQPHPTKNVFLEIFRKLLESVNITDLLWSSLAKVFSSKGDILSMLNISFSKTNLSWNCIFFQLVPRNFFLVYDNVLIRIKKDVVHQKSYVTVVQI